MPSSAGVRSPSIAAIAFAAPFAGSLGCRVTGVAVLLDDQRVSRRPGRAVYLERRGRVEDLVLPVLRAILRECVQAGDLGEQHAEVRHQGDVQRERRPDTGSTVTSFAMVSVPRLGISISWNHDTSSGL